MGAAALLDVTYTAEPDTHFHFHDNGTKLHFGRDEDRCEIIIWSAINGNDLSRVAGCLWRMDDELWVRNLSTRHELQLELPQRPPETPLPPRRDDGLDRGPARSIPMGLAFIRGPGGCELLVRQIRESDDQLIEPESEAAMTVRAPAVPPDLRAVAAALCEPLLAGGQLPASHAQVTARAATGSQKRTRLQIARLCALYTQEIPALRQRVAERIRREAEQLGLDADRHLRAGVWTFEPADTIETRLESQDSARRRALALPDYYEVAHLLVRRDLILHADVEALPGDLIGKDGGAK